MIRQIEMDAHHRRTGSKSASFVVSGVIHASIIILVILAPLLMTPDEDEKIRVPEKTIEATLIRALPKPDAGSVSGAGTPVDDRPKTARPKALAQRVAVANVQKLSSVVQQQITRVTPTPVLGQQQVEKVNVEKIRTTVAPKNVTQTRIQTRVVAEIGDVQPYSVATGPAASNTKVRAPTTLSQTGGPKVQDAAGPVLQTSALAYQQPTIAEGVVGSYTVQGSPDGPKIRVMEPGTGSGFFDGEGGQGAGSGGGPGNGDGGRAWVAAEPARGLAPRGRGIATPICSAARIWT